jgi:predicted transcriptional regulator
MIDSEDGLSAKEYSEFISLSKDLTDNKVRLSFLENQIDINLERIDSL